MTLKANDIAGVRIELDGQLGSVDKDAEVARVVAD